MKILNTSFDTTIDAQPITSGTLDFLQLSYKEGFSEIIKSTIGREYDPTKVYLLEGGKITPAIGDSYNVAAGSCFYNGEFFLIDVVGGSGISMPDYIGMTVSTSQYTTNADPTIFYSGTPHNVHDIRKMVYYDSPTPAAISAPINYLNDTISNYGTIYQPDNAINSAMNGAYITFEKDKNITFTADSAVNSIYLDPTNAKQGSTVKIYQSDEPGIVVNIYATHSTSLLSTGDGYFDANGNYSATITYLGTSSSYQFLVEHNTTSGGALPMTAYYLGTYINHGTIPLKMTKSNGRVFISGKLNDSAPVSYSAGVTSSVMALPVGFRPSRDVFDMQGIGDLTTTYAPFGLHINSAGLVIAYGPFTSNYGFLKIEFDTAL